MPGRKLRFTTALLPSGWHDDVLVTIGDDGMIAEAEPDASGRSGAAVRGVAVAGMPNVHSHAHQRAMAGLAERSGPGADSFWSWREIMYGFALKMNPDDLEAVAAQLYVEALKSGYTSIGEFQYLHHGPDGRPYDGAGGDVAALPRGGGGGRHRHHAVAGALLSRRLRRPGARRRPEALRQRRRAVCRHPGAARQGGSARIRAPGSASRRIPCAP